MPISPTTDGDAIVKLTILSNGAEISSDHKLISVKISKQVNKIPFARIILGDGDMPDADFPVSNGDAFKPGADIKIKAGYGDSDNIVFDGIVIKHGIKILEGNTSQLDIECRSKAVKMIVGRKNANYTDVSDSTLISNIISSYSGLTSDIDQTNTQYKELVQYYCTDWDFILSRAEVNGLIVIVGDTEISVKAPETDEAASLKVVYGQDLINFEAEMDARWQLSSVKGVSWDLESQDVVEQTSEEPSLNSQGNISSADLAKVMGLDTYTVQTSAPVSKEGLKSWVDAQRLKSGIAKIRGRMKFQGSHLAKPGTLIEIDGVGKRFSGDAFISSVVHNISSGNWITEVCFGMEPEWFVENKDIEAPLTGGFLPGIDGLHIGIVKKLDEDPDSQYKIQVSVPVLQADKDGIWARLAGFYSSSEVGAFFIPEIGDEVVLGYFNNDPCHPVILGSLYSSKNKPPYEIEAENPIKAIVTKSKLKMEFDDKKKVTTIMTPAGNKIVLSDDDKSILITDENQNKVELSSNGIVLDSPKDIKITAKGKITLEALSDIGLSSKSDVKIEGVNINNNANAGFVGKGSATAEVSASGKTTIKGAMVMIN